MPRIAAPPIAHYLTLAEAARELNMVQREFRRLIDTGKGPPVTRVTGGLLFRDDALAGWVGARRG